MASGHAPGVAVVGATVALALVAAIATIGRLFTRLFIVHSFGIDDICITAAVVFSVALTVAMCEQVNYGMGRHYDTLTDNDKQMALHWMWSSIWIYYLALGCVKCSILLQYLRIFPQNAFRVSCYVMIGIIITYTCWTFFSAVFACVPIASFWDMSIQGHCLNRLAVWFSNAAINIATDIGTAILPLPSLRSLNLPKRQKIALMLVFGLGGVTCIVSILRLQSLYVISKASDLTWENPLAAIWSDTEVNIGILCSCLPTLKGCVSRIFPKLFNSSAHSRSGGSIVEMNNKATPSRNRGSTKFSRHDDPEDVWRPSKSHDRRNIHVVTVLEQEVERDGRDDGFSAVESDSVKQLVRGSSYLRN